MGEETKLNKATFAGGCFWCMKAAFEKVEGVEKVVSGYTGGEGENPTYEDYGKKGHIEVIQITYSPSQVTYSDLLHIFWRNIDPLDAEGQFCDRGNDYIPAIFYHNEEQKNLAEKSKEKLQNSFLFDKPIATKIKELSKFYPAEAYHQNYYKKHPIKYKFYRLRCGRGERLNEIWGESKRKNKFQKKNAKCKKNSSKELKKKLTSLQFKVTQRDVTEPAYKNRYWDNEREGIYIDIVSGEPLFSSIDKFKSGTGWPSFTKPLEPNNIVEKEVPGLFSSRTEVRSKHADSHLGHVFEDGPEPTGLRYCINSTSLKFIPKEKLGEKGYGEYKKLFDKENTE